MCGGAIISDFTAFKGARSLSQSDLWLAEFENLNDAFDSNDPKLNAQQGEQSENIWGSLQKLRESVKLIHIIV